MKKNLITFIALAFLTAASSLFGQIQSNGTGGGNWDSTSTWQGGVVPDSTSNVVILGTDSVFLTSAGRCLNLTLNAGAKLALNASGLSIPGTSWNFNNTSTVFYKGPTTVQTDMTYGNLVYATTANGGVSTTSPGNLTVNGNFSITASTFRGIATTSGTVTHTIAGNVIVGPGTSARITGVNNGSATTASCTWNIGGDLSLISGNSGNRLIMYESAGPHSGSAVFNINGDLSIAASSQVQFKSSSATTADYPEGIINLKGNLVHNGTIGINSGSGTSAGLTINFVGTNPQNWSGTGTFSVSTFSVNMNINNAAGVTLASPKTIPTKTKVMFTNGKLNTSSVNLLTVTTGSLVGASASSFINGPSGFSVASTGPAEIIFPVGKGSAFRPLTLTLTHDSATATLYTAEMFNGIAPANTLPSSLDKVTSVRYFTISKGTGASVQTAVVKLSYDVDDGVSDYVNLRIAKDDGAGNWVDLGGVGTGNITGTITSTVNFTGFSNFLLANHTGGSNIIPVEFTSFSSAVNGNEVTLMWSTATESNNYGFEIERAAIEAGQKNWIEAGFVNGSGNTTEPAEYIFTDKIPQSGAYSYRIKQIDYNGNFRYTNELYVDINQPTVFSVTQNYPNPFNPETNFDYSLSSDARVIVDIYTLTGEKAASLVNEDQSAGYYTFRIDANELNLTSGMYIYRLTAFDKSNNVFTQSRKMILLK